MADIFLLTCMFCVMSVKICFSFVCIPTNIAKMFSHVLTLMNHFHMIGHRGSFDMFSTDM